MGSLMPVSMCMRVYMFLFVAQSVTELLVNIRSSPAESRFTGISSVSPVRFTRSRCPSDVLGTVSTAVLDFVGVDACLAYAVSGFATDFTVESSGAAAFFANRRDVAT